MRKRITKKIVNELTYQIIGAAIEVHRVLGPGLLESNYEKALIHELHLRGFKTDSQKGIKATYKGLPIECPMRCDVLVEDIILVENKSAIEMHPVYDATLLSYMKHSKIPKGILLNYNVTNLYHEGRKTFVNEYFALLPDF